MTPLRHSAESEALRACAPFRSLEATGLVSEQVLDFAFFRLGLIRFGGHLSCGGYDVQTYGRHTQASASPVH